MKTKLLYIAGFFLMFFTSCSVDENLNVFSEQENNLKVKSLIKTFVEDVIPSSSFSKFIEEAQIKTSSGLTEEEELQLEQDFLSQQSPEFVELYYYVKSLNLSEDQLREIIIEYLTTINKNSFDETKNDSSECIYGDSQGGSSTLWALILTVLCEVEKSVDDD